MKLEMNECDVVIVGAGPAGSAAAKTSAERGAKTILLEEHTTIGVPTHCTGGLFSPTRPDFTEEILRTLGKHLILREYKAAHVFAPSGKLVKEISLSGKGCYLIERAQFDRDLARLAINAGAELWLNACVTGLLKKGKIVTGVSIGSKGASNVVSKVVIAAEGMHGPLKGIPKWEGLTRADQTTTGGISLELTRVNGLEPDIIEFHFGSFTPKGWVTIWPRDAVSCMTHFMKLADFERVKIGDYLLSKRLRDAFPLRITGYSHTSDWGLRLPEIVKDGLIVTGSGANWRGIISAIVSGRYAGEIAAEAVKEGDVTMEKLGKYLDLYESGLNGKDYQHKGYMQGFPFYQRSDQVIEELLLDMIERNKFPFP
jgi:digeranylgeranylglycerophospholipid reductase